MRAWVLPLPVRVVRLIRGIEPLRFFDRRIGMYDLAIPRGQLDRESSVSDPSEPVRLLVQIFAQRRKAIRGPDVAAILAACFRVQFVSAVTRPSRWSKVRCSSWLSR